MIYLALSKKGKETEEDIKKIAKKTGYKVRFDGEDDNFKTYTLIKNKVGHPSKKVPKDKIIAMREEGKSVNEIAQELGVSRSSIYNYLK